MDFARYLHDGMKLCSGHMRQIQRGKPLSQKRPAPQPIGGKICEFDGCDESVKSMSLCMGHYSQYLKRGKSREGLVPLMKQSWSPCPMPKCDHKVFIGYRVCKKHRNLAVRFNMGIDFMLKLFENAHCSGCGTEENLHVDHWHGHHERQHDRCEDCIRGLLCGGCNTGLGMMREDPEVLANLISYLARFTEPTDKGVSRSYEVATKRDEKGRLLPVHTGWAKSLQ